MVQLPEFIALPADTSSEDECDDGYEPGGARFEDDPFRASRRRRYFAGILDARAREKANRTQLDTNGITESKPPSRTGTRTVAPIKREDVKEEPIPDIVYEYEPGYETPEARLEHLRREVYSWCGGRAHLNMDNLKPESQDFVDGRLTATYMYTLGQCVQAEAKAAKRRTKRHRKKYYSLVREGKIEMDMLSFEEFEELSLEEKYANEEQQLIGVSKKDDESKQEDILLDMKTKANAEESAIVCYGQGVNKDIGLVPTKRSGYAHMKEEDQMEWSGTAIVDGSIAGKGSEPTF